MEFQSWKVNFKTEVCSKSADFQLTVQWIKEVEISKSIDDHMTSRSITGRTDFSRLRCAWCDDCVCIEEASHQLRALPKKSKVSKSNVLKYTTDSYEEAKLQTLSMSMFEPPGADEAVQGLSDLFNIRLHNDDVQDFDTRWDSSSMIRK